MATMRPFILTQVILPPGSVQYDDQLTRRVPQLIHDGFRRHT